MQDEVPHVALDAIESPQTPWGQWIGLAIGVAALLTSIVSIWLAVKNAGAMNQLVQANSWPHLQVTSGNLDDYGKRSLHFEITNAGAGPAKLHTMDMMWEGKPLSKDRSLLSLCCADVENETLDRAITEFTAGRVLRAGETIRFLEIPFEERYAQTFERLDKARFDQLSFSGCYCSVFDECWKTNFNGLEQEPVASCERP